MKHSLKEWFLISKPWSFPASSMPVVVSLVYLWNQADTINWLNGVLCLLCMVGFQAFGNLYSDYADYNSGVDADDTYSIKTLTDKIFTPKQVLYYSYGVISVVVLLGLLLVFRCGWPILIFGAVGILLSFFYPFLKYHALGDVDILFCYSVIPMLGTSYAAIGHIDYNLIWYIVPVGLITIAILHANNSRDMNTDKRAGIYTLPMFIGKNASCYLYCFEVIFPFLWVLVCALTGKMPEVTPAVFIPFVIALNNAKQMMKFKNGDNSVIATLDKSTAQLQLFFSGIFVIVLIINKVLL